MDEQNRVLSVVGKLYLDLVQAHDILGQLRQQNGQLATTNQQLVEKIKAYEQNHIGEVELKKDIDNGSETQG